MNTHFLPVSDGAVLVLDGDNKPRSLGEGSECGGYVPRLWNLSDPFNAELLLLFVV